MDDPTTTATLDQTDEDILTFTVSDDALEAAAGIGAVTPFDFTMNEGCILTFRGNPGCLP
jgi:hypothetical protein